MSKTSARLLLLCLGYSLAVQASLGLKSDDPRLERINRLLEETYKLRNHRGLDARQQQESSNAVSEVAAASSNEIKTYAYDSELNRWYPIASRAARSKYDEFDPEIANEELYKQSDKFRKQAPPPKAKPIARVADADDPEDDEESWRQPELVPIPHPIPIVIQKPVHVPVIIHHSIPFSLLQMLSPANVRAEPFVNPLNAEPYQSSNDPHTAMHRSMSNFHRQPTVGFN